MVCVCANCTSEGYFEHVHGHIPDQCIYKNAENRRDDGEPVTVPEYGRSYAFDDIV